MTVIYIGLAILGFGGVAALVGYFYSLRSTAKDEGRHEVRDAIIQEALDAKKREAASLAEPSRSKSDNIARLRKARGK